MDKIATYAGKDINKLKKAELVDIINQQQRQIISICERTYINPPMVIMPSEELHDKYWALKEENESYTNLFWRVYIK